MCICNNIITKLILELHNAIPYNQFFLTFLQPGRQHFVDVYLNLESFYV